jgi:ribonuclease HI
MIVETVFLHFDGGTPCNIPSKGYGIGYGSYRFNDNPVIKVDHGIPCSNNGAEILTLCCGLEELLRICNLEDNLMDASTTEVVIMGDSQTTLSWVEKVIQKGGSVKVNSNVSESMKIAIQRLIPALGHFAQVKTRWLERSHAVRAFGH